MTAQEIQIVRIPQETLRIQQIVDLRMKILDKVLDSVAALVDPNVIQNGTGIDAAGLFFHDRHGRSCLGPQRADTCLIARWHRVTPALVRVRVRWVWTPASVIYPIFRNLKISYHSRLRRSEYKVNNACLCPITGGGPIVKHGR